MARYFVTGTSSTALATDTTFAALVPAAAVGCRTARLILGTSTGATAPSDFQIVVGVNRGTARGTATATSTGVKADPDSAASQITGVDTTWSVAPTLAAADAFRIAYNTRGGADTAFALNDLVTTVGTANIIALVQRSGASLPAGHAIVWTIEWDE